MFRRARSRFAFRVSAKEVGQKKVCLKKDPEYIRIVSNLVPPHEMVPNSPIVTRRLGKYSFSELMHRDVILVEPSRVRMASES